MQKTLRSLIHEKIPEELRFQLELLSRKRNLINDEKHAKILELFREFNIEGIVPLGPGTNRYAIKIDGYVVKIATDNDGKIDNFKEFKMAKRLYPYVTKTYEVSENGTLLVAEYISPFSSYYEMTMYAEQIREILTKLSSTYLIGDVGITAKNYANWGLRAGSSEPVCLDFAYVYEVSSELFVCRKCQTNSMLIPNRDFTELICSNPSCNAKYQFENIRSMLGNDLHKHEIGDLKQEGYYLTESNVTTELSEQRSNYLVNKKATQPKEELEIDIEEDISMNKNLENNMAIAKAIASANSFKISIVNASAVNDNEEDDDIITVTAEAVIDEEDNTSDIAFVGSIDETDESDEDEENIDSEESEVVMTDIIQKPINDEDDNNEVENVIETNDNDEDDENDVITVTAVVDNDEPEVVDEVDTTVEKKKSTTELNKWFIKNASKAVSKLSDRVAKCLSIDSQYDDVKNDIKGINHPEDYYKNIETTVYRSLVSFMEFTEHEEPRDSGGYRRIFTAPSEISESFEPTMIFIARVWNNRAINTVENPDMMKVYRETYSDYQGIQREWIDVFKKRLAMKMKIASYALDEVANVIAEMWCVPEEVVAEKVPEDVNTKSVTDETEETVEVDIPVMAVDTPNANDRIYTSEMVESVLTDTIDDNEEDEIVFSGAMDVDVIQNPVSDEDDDDEYEEEDDDDEYSVDHLSVNIIISEDEWDIVRVTTIDKHGPIIMQFQLPDINEIDGSSKVPSIVDDRNGMWDWLIHITPDLKFTTKDPNKWMNLNDIQYTENDSILRVVILDEMENYEYLMGIYLIDGIYSTIDDETSSVYDETVIKQINDLIRLEIGHGYLSQLRRTVDNMSNIMSEDDIKHELSIDIDELKSITGMEADEEESEVEAVNTEAIDAAVAAMMDDEPVTEVSDDNVAAPEEVAAPTPFRGGDDRRRLDKSESVISNEEEGTSYSEEAVEEGKENDEGYVTFKPIHRLNN